MIGQIFVLCSIYRLTDTSQPPMLKSIKIRINVSPPVRDVAGKDKPVRVVCRVLL